MNVTDFLEARITEDEEMANMAKAEFAHGGYGCYGPARVLAECAAKRKIIHGELSYAAVIDGEFGCDHDGDQIRRGECEDYPITGKGYRGLPIISALASVYSDHPDYQQEWAQ